MPRNLIVLCDGTANQVEADRSNVLRLYGCLKRDAEQLVFYDPGVGTFGLRGPFTRFRSGWALVKGLALGTGIDDNVFEAYRFLVENHRRDDEIYLFGFSRGAYTVRLLAGFIRVFGLMRREQLHLLEYAWRAYLRADGEVPFAEAKLYQNVLKAFKPRIRFLGIWDTVASVFEQSPSGFWLQRRQRPYTSRNEHIETVRHAVAIDERRTMFQPSLWIAGQKYEYWAPAENRFVTRDQDFREVWFAGCHSDVGGGYPEAESGLAKVATVWMIDEASAAGARFDPDTVDRIVHGKGTEPGDDKYIKPNPSASIHDSMNRRWAILEYLPRRITALTSKARLKLGRYYIPLKDARNIPEAATIDVSVRKHMADPAANPPYRPSNLPAHWLWSDGTPGPP